MSNLILVVGPCVYWFLFCWNYWGMRCQATHETFCLWSKSRSGRRSDQHLAAQQADSFEHNPSKAKFISGGAAKCTKEKLAFKETLPIVASTCQSIGTKGISSGINAVLGLEMPLGSRPYPICSNTPEISWWSTGATALSTLYVLQADSHTYPKCQCGIAFKV